MRRIASVWLPRWPILRFLTAQGSSGPIAPDQPFVLVVEASGGPRLAATNPAAESYGLYIGQTLGDARAKAGGLLQVRPLESDKDAEALRRLTLWATRYTPAASAWTSENGGDGFFLDLTGCAHLFGGEAALLDDLMKRLQKFHLAARCAIAGTAGAAWALSHHAASPRLCLEEGKEKEALHSLPVKALRLTSDTHEALRRLGFKRIGMLSDAARASFAARFENELLQRLDQALGGRPEALEFIQAPPAYHAQRSFLDPIFAQDIVVAAARKLMERLIPALERDGAGIRALSLDLYRVDGEIERLALGLAAPTRDPAHVARLISLKLDGLTVKLEKGFGFDCVRLSVLLAEPLSVRQGDLDAACDQAAMERQASLIDAMRQRLGPQSVRQLKPVESHIPERAEICLRAEGPVPSWPEPGEDRLRPPLLLPEAEPAEVMALVPDGPPRRFRWRGRNHDVAWAQGPERIACEWWRSTGEEPTRDYYCLENQTGQRFWLYREGLYGRETTSPRWFVHGLFA
jgi:protein ImuB